MNLEDVFGLDFVSLHDTETERVCGTCGQLKPVSAFYKDGKDKYGKIRYRRDCRECYKNTRIIEAKFKKGQKK